MQRAISTGWEAKAALLSEVKARDDLILLLAPGAASPQLAGRDPTSVIRREMGDGMDPFESGPFGRISPVRHAAVMRRAPGP